MHCPPIRDRDLTRSAKGNKNKEQKVINPAPDSFAVCVSFSFQSFMKQEPCNFPNLIYEANPPKLSRMKTSCVRCCQRVHATSLPILRQYCVVQDPLIPRSPSASTIASLCLAVFAFLLFPNPPLGPRFGPGGSCTLTGVAAPEGRLLASSKCPSPVYQLSSADAFTSGYRTKPMREC